MFQIDLKNRKPIYEQVIESFKNLILSGELNEASRVPSVRDMAKALGVNPNTIQKAYRELEAQKYFYTVIGQGSFIAAPPESAASKEVSALYEALAGNARELIFRGENFNAILNFIKNMEGSNDKN